MKYKKCKGRKECEEKLKSVWSLRRDTDFQEDPFSGGAGECSSMLVECKRQLASPRVCNVQDNYSD